MNISAPPMTQIDRIGRLTGPLTITCTACGHHVTWTPAQAKARLGVECTTTAARRRLRCSKCEGKYGRFVAFSAGPIRTRER